MDSSLKISPSQQVATVCIRCHIVPMEALAIRTSCRSTTVHRSITISCYILLLSSRFKRYVPLRNHLLLYTSIFLVVSPHILLAVSSTVTLHVITLINIYAFNQHASCNNSKDIVATYCVAMLSTRTWRAGWGTRVSPYLGCCHCGFVSLDGRTNLIAFMLSMVFGRLSNRSQRPSASAEDGYYGLIAVLRW